MTFFIKYSIPLDLVVAARTLPVRVYAEFKIMPTGVYLLTTLDRLMFFLFGKGKTKVRRVSYPWMSAFIAFDGPNTWQTVVQKKLSVQVSVITIHIINLAWNGDRIKGMLM